MLRYQADEWKYWLFYWSPIILQNTLCFTIHICHYQAKQLILEFVDEVELQYGKHNMVYKLHLLRHIPEYFGPLWVYWFVYLQSVKIFRCFPFEKLLGYFSQFVFATKN